MTPYKKDLIDHRVDEVLERGKPMKVKKAALAIRKSLGAIPEKPGIELADIVLTEIERRLSRALRKHKDSYGFRTWECFSDGGTGGMRYQLLATFGATELRGCLHHRQIQASGHLRAIEFFQRLLALLEAREGAVVADVYDEAVEGLG